MDSKEFGLVAAQQLFQVEDLHYGFWYEGEEATLGNWQEAQKAHTKFLFKHIFEYAENKDQSRLLDIGCGVGITTKKLLDLGYKVDGLVPYPWMAKYASKITSEFRNNHTGEIYECKFENFDIVWKKKKYRLVFFSESFQYVKLIQSFNILEEILDKNGIIIIFDFFKKDNIEGVSPLGGGHSLGEFYQVIEKYNYNILSDIDVTRNLSPNLKLVNEMITNRLTPFSSTLDKFLFTRYKTFYKLIKWGLRKQLSKLAFKYSKDRNEENFIKFKSYRLIVLSKEN